MIIGTVVRGAVTLFLRNLQPVGRGAKAGGEIFGEAEVRHQPERKVYEVWSEVHVKIAKLASEGESDGGK